MVACQQNSMEQSLRRAHADRSHSSQVWRDDGPPPSLPIFISELNIAWNTGESFVDIFGGLWLAVGGNFHGILILAGITSLGVPHPSRFCEGWEADSQHRGCRTGLVFYRPDLDGPHNSLLAGLHTHP